VESKPLAQRLSAWLDRDQENAEDSRLLYVATTRAREKLLISGHLTAGKSGYRAYGWLKEMLTAMDIPPDEVIDMGWGDRVIQLRSGSEAAVFIQANRDIQGSSNDASQMETKEWPERDAMPLFSPLRDVMTKEVDTVERRQDWRVTGEEIKTPEVVTGSLVHEALQRWLFPENPHFVEQMEAAALRHGLIALHQRRRAVGDAQRMLTALRIHPLWEEINTAVERRHELPYALRLEDGTYDNGFMDLLYGSAENGWTVLDFKTDELSSHAAVDEAIRRHTAQMRRYGRAVQRILNQSPKLKLCFLNTNLGVQVQIVSM